MGQGKQTPCKAKGCGKPCYGDTCRGGCIEAARHKQFALGSGSGVSIPKVAPTVGPWWIGLSREQLQAQAHQHADRMSRGAAGNFRTVAESITS